MVLKLPKNQLLTDYTSPLRFLGVPLADHFFMQVPAMIVVARNCRCDNNGFASRLVEHVQLPILDNIATLVVAHRYSHLLIAIASGCMNLLVEATKGLLVENVHRFR